MKRTTILGTAMLISLAIACQQSKQAAPTPAQGSAIAVQPVIEIQRLDEVTFEPGIKFMDWKLRACRVGELTARLLVIKDGKSNVAQEMICKWDAWPENRKEAIWHLHYVLQDGEPFGAKNKRMPGISMTFDDVAPTTTARKRSVHLVEGEFRSTMAESRRDNTLDPTRAEMLYHSFHVPVLGDSSVSIERNVDSLIEATKGGRTAVVIVVEWKPVGGK